MAVNDAYWAGYNDYLNGHMTNPYYDETDEWYDWERGYADAAWDD